MVFTSSKRKLSVGSEHLLHICEIVKMPWKAEEMPLRHSLSVWTVGGTSQVPYPGSDLGWSSLGRLDLGFCRQDFASFKYLQGFLNLGGERFVERF